MGILETIGLSVIAGILYRVGGAKWGHTLFRDVGCPTINILTLILLHHYHFSQLLCFPILWAAYSTYRYFLPKPKEYGLLYYCLHGLMCALAIFPYIYFSHHWMGLIYRCVIASGLVGLWSVWINNDNIEEAGRGFIINLSIVCV